MQAGILWGQEGRSLAEATHCFELSPLRSCEVDCNAYEWDV
jgi:hypothetical protein